MANFSDQHIQFASRMHGRRGATALSKTAYDGTTSPGERFLLFMTVMIYPLENHIRIVPGVSSMFLIFAVLAVYVAINRLGCLDGVWMHPVFVSAYGFMGVSLALEFASPLSSYADIGRFALMIAGALVVASLCRDREALQMLLYGYIGAALWLGAVLFLTSYGTLSGVVATDFKEATEIRSQAFSNMPIYSNLNGMAFICAQGGIVGLAIALGCGSAGRRNLLFVIATFCFTASALTMSRGGIAISILSCAIILYARGLNHGRALLLVGILCGCVFLLAPDAIWSRMAFSMEGEQGQESRAALYNKALAYLPDYVTTGVGAGNFAKKWGWEKGFVIREAFGLAVAFVHNSFLQVTINWGLPGLLAFIAIIWQAYRCIPKRSGSDPVTLSLLGIAVSLILILHFAHNFNDKIFSLGLGMLVGYQRWLAPTNGVRSADR